MGEPDEATILHADLDAFYASVEQLLDPRLRGRPVVVGGGVVLAASYEARARGVRGGMPGWRARQLCPELVSVGGHFREYQRLGDEVMAILRDVTPLVERVSIDEAFLDVRGTRRLFGDPTQIARSIRQRVRSDVGLPISVGVATTKHLAKVASQVAKPDGLVVVPAGTERRFLAPLPVGLLWGVGPVTRQRLAGRGITTIGELVELDRGHLERLLGSAIGRSLHERAANVDRRRVVDGSRNCSMGAQSALGRRAATPEQLRTTLGHLADRVTGRMRRASLTGRTITTRVRFTDLRSVTRSVTLPEPIAETLTVTSVAVELAAAALRDHPEEREISLLGLSVSGLVGAAPVQLELELGLPGATRRPGSGVGVARRSVDRAVDAVRDRFGRDAVGLAGVQLRGDGGVPDAFRELAERNGRPPSDGS
ncbi:DNA polymerase IV [Actinomarinicola tropica]|uniref:DNA polymerase IV n=1 Tax=Actinomarinicola tropica TaxID=2789776 RepID=A0A5Q2RIF8_9ACTN|nr:DNA polymerase IV [Actinomarinicola tropica]QGG95324.1 DNA polymerase IV [Actinomarinicola tropica]